MERRSWAPSVGLTAPWEVVFTAQTRKAWGRREEVWIAKLRVPFIAGSVARLGSGER